MSSKVARKFFLCTGECVPAERLAQYPRSHIIGELCYVTDEGKQMSALAVYETSVPSSIVPSVAIEIRAEIIGDARRIKCTVAHCNHVKHWVLGKQSYMQLQQRYGKAML